MALSARRIGCLVVLVAGAMAGPTPRVEAGPPLVCWPIDIGEAKSLPWGDGVFAYRKDYDVSRLVADTLAILDADAPVLVRMETLRRATLYATSPEAGRTRGAAAAWELVARLMARILDAEGKGTPVPRWAWLDAGYLVGACAQADLETGFAGYTWARCEGEARPLPPEAHFALALMTVMGGNRSEFEEHVRKALEGASEGSLLAKNLLTHLGGTAATLDALRAKYPAKSR